MMYCDRCKTFGIYWKNLGGYNQHTYCPNCNGVNCQQHEIENTDDMDEADAQSD